MRGYRAGGCVRRGVTEQEGGPAPSPLEGKGGGEGSLGEGCGIFVYGMMMRTTGAWGRKKTGFPLTTCGNDRRGGGGNACTLTFVIGGQKGRLAGMLGDRVTRGRA